MTKRTTPFLVEGMSAEKRENRIARVFALIEPKSGRVATEGVRIQRTFVFVPDPPPQPFETETKKIGGALLAMGCRGVGGSCRD